jgi:aspartate racemase
VKVKKIIGILGGMGPYATLAFSKVLLDNTKAERDCDYVHTIIDSNPQIPSRTRAYLFDETSPVEGMIKSAKKLIDSGAIILTLPCNSAHYFLPEVEKALHVKFINMVEATSKYIIQKKYKKIGILGGEVTVGAKLYEKELLIKNISVVHVDRERQKTVRAIIEDVKRNCITETTKRDLKKILEHLYDKNCETVILACTELGSVIEAMEDNCSIVDSLDCLARAALKAAKKYQ